MFNLQEYIANIDSFEGWCHPLTAAIMNHLALSQETEGNILEIGVHHGKSFIPMANGIKNNEVAIALDIFEDQQYNYDGSGNGNKELFINNINRFIGTLDGIKIIKHDSTNIPKEDLIINNMNLRMASVDGAHTLEATLSDLHLVDSLLLEEDGIVFLDDFLNSHWLGVISGYFSFIAEKPNSLIPIAMIPNKLILCRPNTALKYKELLKISYGQSITKHDVPLSSHIIDIYQ